MNASELCCTVCGYSWLDQSRKIMQQQQKHITRYIEELHAFCMQSLKR